MSNVEPESRLADLTIALEVAQTMLSARMDELSLVRRIGDSISTFTSTPALCAGLVEAIAETVACRHAAIYSGHAGSPFHLQALSEVFGPAGDFPEALTDSRVSRIIAERHTSIRIDDTALGSSVATDGLFPDGLPSLLFVPLVEGRNLRGILCLADDRPNAFSEETERTLMLVVPQIANALTKISLSEGVRTAERKYRTLVESMQDVAFVCDRDWKIESVNAAGREIFGQSIAGQVLTDLFSSPAAVQEFLAEAGSCGMVRNFEAEMATEKPSRPTVLLSCVAHENGYSGIIKDVTERTRLMDQVIRAQKMESVGTLAAGVAHDFNNILGIIMPNAQLIQLRTPLDPAVSKHADVIIAASRRANKLTRQLLSLARRDPIQVRPINLNESIRTTCGLAENSLGKQISVHLVFESDPIYIRADESQLEQILLNLAINARDAMPNGGTLTFQTKREGNEILLRIADTGTGMRKEILPNIFEPFFTTKDKATGTGLGLSVVHSLVKQIGGSIAVHSELGCGTEFVLRFPAIAVPAELPRLPLPDSSAGNERILIVDDEPEMRDLLATLLNRMGYDVACAKNGMEAVNQVSSEYQLVIMDMMMPVMDGLTAVHAIRQKHPDMKILVASGDAAADAFPTLRRMKVQGIVQKPFELQTLAHLIRDVLDGVAA